MKWLLLFILAVIGFTACIGQSPAYTPAAPLDEVRVEITDYVPQNGYNSEAMPDDADLPIAESGFPILQIASSYDPFTVEREFWHDGSLSLTALTAEHSFRDVNVRLRGRGNSTWIRGEDKRPLRFRFEEARTLFDSPYPHRDWILLANHFDLSLLRNYAAFYLAAQMGSMDFVPSSQFVHLYVNDEYMGVYQIVDERDFGPGRMTLAFNPDPALSEFLFELDGHAFRGRDGEEGIDFFVVDERAYTIRFPGPNDHDGHLEYLRDFVEKVNQSIHSHDFEAISSAIDLQSFVDFYIVQELFKNIDVGNFSVFMQLRGQNENRKIYFGPVWDFDRSAGNTLYWAEPEHVFAAVYNVWFREMLAVPEISALVSSRWNEITDGPIEKTIERLRFLADQYEEEFSRNFERHNVWENNPPWFDDMLPEVNTSIVGFSSQAEYLINWLAARRAWLTDRVF